MQDEFYIFQAEKFLFLHKSIHTLLYFMLSYLYIGSQLTKEALFLACN